MKNKAQIKALVAQLHSLCGDDEEEMEGGPKEKAPLSGEDADNGGANGVTDMSPELDMPSDAQLMPKKKKSLDVIAMSIKKKMGK